MPLFRDLSNVSAAVLASALLLTACGGGEQKETFQPTRIIALGDENSLIVAGTGRQYSVNNTTVGTASAGGIACQNNPIWVEYVAADYGLPFAECGANAEKSNALMRATVGGTANTVQAAVDTINRSAAPINSKDLVTLMVGSHDLLEIMGENKMPSVADYSEGGVLYVAAQNRGLQVGNIIQQIVARGAKVLFASTPYLSTAPVALPGITNGGYSGAALYQLSKAFNDGLNLGSQLPNGGGRNGAVLQVNDLIQVYIDQPDTYTSITNRVQAACMTNPTTIMPDAELNTCVASATTDTAKFGYLWAGRVQFGTLTHGMVGAEAVARIRANPL